MKINETPRVGKLNPYAKQQETPFTKTDNTKAKRKDEVQISNEAKELQEALAAGAKQPAEEARLRKIGELKNAVSTGTYHVDAGKIAEKLLPHLTDSQS